jgi:hypothetical protein
MCRTIEAGEVVLEDRAAVEAPSTSNRFFTYAFLLYLQVQEFTISINKGRAIVI